MRVWSTKPLQLHTQQGQGPMFAGGAHVARWYKGLFPRRPSVMNCAAYHNRRPQQDPTDGCTGVHQADEPIQEKQEHQTGQSERSNLL